MLDGTIDLPAVGPVKKQYVAIVGGGSALFVLYMYYRNWTSVGTDDSADTVDTGYEDAGILPAVSGAVSPDNSYGIDDGSDTSTSGSITTNDQWSRYALAQLQQSDRWSYSDMAAALGKYLENKPLTSAAQEIVQAAIAVAGYPPVGSHTIISGGDTGISVAPTGLRLVEATTTSVKMAWNAVAGATGYRLYRSGVSQVVGVANGTTGEIGGLTTNQSYSIQVAAFNAAGNIGPKSSAVTVRTKAVSLSKPGTPTVSGITKSSATAKVAKVANATGYNWYLNGQNHGHSDAPIFTFQGLAANRTYKVSVAADTATTQQGPRSAERSFKTKTK
jgi:hypothetical protein